VRLEETKEKKGKKKKEKRKKEKKEYYGLFVFFNYQAKLFYQTVQKPASTPLMNLLHR
jgi:hypothetical protein